MRRHPRPGLTLTEVLVAMFVMALGLMALATLFPLGALQIGQALKDDRTAQTAMLADGWLRVYWRDAAAAYTTNPSALPAENALAGLDDPNVYQVAVSGSTVTYTAPTAGAGLALLPGNPMSLNTAANTQGFAFQSPNDTSLVGVQMVSNSGSSSTVRPNSRPLSQTASYPVLVDPLGFLSRNTSLQFERHWVGRNSVGSAGGVYGLAPGSTPLLLPRRNTAPTGGPFPSSSSAQAAYAACALSDDLTYQPNGGSGQTTTDPSTGAATPQPLGRQGRYTWAALIQRADNSLPHKASLKVLVFDGRPVGFAAAGDEVVLMNDVSNNVQFHAGATAGSRSLSLLLPPRGPDQAPLLRRGGWVMLAVTEPQTVGTSPNTRAGVRKVSFHRVTGLTSDDELAAGKDNPLLLPITTPVVQYFGANPPMAVTPVAIDIDPPVPAEFITPASGPPLATQVVLLAGLSEVFDRPDLDASN